MKNGYSIYRCPSCGLGQTRLGKNYIQFAKNHYSKEYFTGDPGRSAYVDYKNDKVLITKNLRKFLRKIKKYKPVGSVLDVGCALGFFVELALESGYDAYGMDVSDYAVSEARSLVGPGRIRQGTIGETQYAEGSFDVITLFDIFEHLADPKQDLDRIVSWLKDDGIIIIATGDTRSFLAKAMGRRWTFYIPPQHLFFFNKDNLTRLLISAHATPKEWFSIGKWLSLRYVLHLARTTGESKLANRMYPILGQGKVGTLPLYIPAKDNMVVIASKHS